MSARNDEPFICLNLQKQTKQGGRNLPLGLDCREFSVRDCSIHAVNSGVISCI